ncbi:MAG: cation diffusion facilitator family transporter [Bdellovibrionota bacterium]
MPKPANLQYSNPSNGPISLAVITTFLALFPSLYVWSISNSTALLADVLRSLSEFLAIFLSWSILRGVNKNKWSGYNYGFGKIEQLASLAVGCALFFSFLIILVAAILRFYNPEPLQNISMGLGLSVLSIIGNAFLWFKNHETCISNPSPVINSQRKLFRAKTFACIIVAVSLALPYFIDLSWGIYADPIGSVLIALFLLYNAIAIATSSLDDLLDRSIGEAYQLTILKTLIKHEAEYKGLDKIRSRRLGARAHIEISLDVDGDRSLRDIELSTAKIKAEIKESIPEAEVIFIYNVA